MSSKEVNPLHVDIVDETMKTGGQSSGVSTSLHRPIDIIGGKLPLCAYSSHLMEATRWVESEGSSNSDVEDGESEDEEFSFMSITVPRLQFRTAKVSIARWDPKLGMGEVMQKGGMWRTTGIVRESKVYCLMEEIMYLAERGALLLLNNDANYFQLKDIYSLVTQGVHGCSWKCFEAYRHLKSLGYVVGRHGLLWTTRCKVGPSSSISSLNCERHLESENLKSEGDSAILTELCSVMDINSSDELEVNFDVYLPNKQFKKSAPGDPSFMLCVAGEIPPTIVQVENLRKQSGDIPIKFAHVDHGRVSIFSYNKVELPTLS